MSLRKALRGDLGGQTTPLGTAWPRMARSRASCKWLLRNKRRNMNKQNRLTSKNWIWLEEEVEAAHLNVAVPSTVLLQHILL